MDTMWNAGEALASIPYFSELDLPVLKALTDVTVLRKYEAGQILFLDGEPCAGLYIVQKGRIKGFKQTSTGREQVIRFMAPGEVFNEIGVLAEGKNLVTAQALEASAVWVIQREAILRLMETYPQLCRLIAQNLAKRVCLLLDLIESLSLRTVESRLAHLLLEQPDGGTTIRQRWATQAEIAAQIGTVPGVVSRILHSLADEELIQIKRHQIEIVDRQGLEAKASRSD